MPVDSKTVFKIRQALWPSALARSFWSFTKVIVSDDAKRVGRMLGLYTDPDPLSLGQLLSRSQQTIRRSPPTNDGPAEPQQPRLLGDAQTQKSMVPVAENPRFAGKPSLEEEVDANPAKRVASALHAHFLRGIKEFKWKLWHNWRPAPNYPPRGSIVVRGMVEIDSPEAWLVFDVTAAWDPKTKTYDPGSMRVLLRRMQIKRRLPLGGA
jgi:hypothetical protein